MSQPIQVLMVEDNPADTELLLRELRKANFNPQWHRVETEADYLSSLRPDLDLIFSDFEMPEFNGLRALELLKERGCDIPFIMVSGTIGEDEAVTAIHQGAADYLMKDRLTRLGTAVGHTLEQAQLRRHSRETEKALTESEGRFRVLFDVAYDAIFISHQGIFVDCNARGLTLFGLPREQIIGQPVFLSSPPTQPDGSDPKERAREHLAAVEAGVPQSFEWLLIRPDGAQVYTDISLGRFEQGGKVYIQAIARDITERKRAEEVLRGVASRTSGLQRRKIFLEFVVIFVLSVLVFVTSYTFGLSDESFAYIESHDEAAGTLLDETIFTLVFFCLAMLVFSYRRWRESRTETLSQTHIAEAMGILHNEMEAQVRQRTSEMVKANEALRIEATERKRADEQIAEQAALLDKTQDAILVRDLEGKILFWNKGAERLYGWTRLEIIGQNINKLVYVDLKEFTQASELMISKGEWHGEFRHLTKDRHEITIEARWTLIRDDEGHPKSVLAINTDITEKKKIEAQFMRAQRMESIGTLAGGIAHDLNNILAPIMMSIDILKTMSDKPQAMTILETIEVSAKRGADIVRQVLSFARGLEGERIEIQPKHLLKDLEAIIKDTFPKSIRLQFSIPSDSWTILGDPTQVHQILLNLCVNARDAMPNGGTLTIGVENRALDEHYAAMNLQAKPGRYVNIKVADSGTGIPPGIRDKIFEPFFTTKELNKGTGLGLSTVMAIVKSHEGNINVYSEQGKGTTFNVYLPAMETSDEARKQQTAQASLPRGNGETILVVDDEASILTITSQTLQAFGYRVLTATDGADAVAAYAKHASEIAVVLTDMMMPIMDGPAAIHALMRMSPTVKIVAASGLNANESVAKAAGAGVRHFLTKPYTAGTLLKTMRAILDET